MAVIPIETWMLFIWAVLGGIGGYFAARRDSKRTINDYINYCTSMAGAAVVVCSFIRWWQKDPSPEFEWGVLPAFSFGIGLLGLTAVIWVIERARLFADRWVSAKMPKEDEDEKTD